MKQTGDCFNGQKCMCVCMYVCVCVRMKRGSVRRKEERAVTLSRPFSFLPLPLSLSFPSFSSPCSLKHTRSASTLYFFLI